MKTFWWSGGFKWDFVHSKFNHTFRDQLIFVYVNYVSKDTCKWCQVLLMDTKEMIKEFEQKRI